MLNEPTFSFLKRLLEEERSVLLGDALLPPALPLSTFKPVCPLVSVVGFKEG